MRPKRIENSLLRTHFLSQLSYLISSRRSFPQRTTKECTTMYARCRLREVPPRPFSPAKREEKIEKGFQEKQKQKLHEIWT